VNGIRNAISCVRSQVMARGQQIALALGSMDAFVAAMAEAHNLTLTTRNVKDFQRLGISLFDPWQPD